MSIIDSIVRRVGAYVVHELGLDSYDRHALAERLTRIERDVAYIRATPTANARTYEVGYDEHGNGIVRSEPMPPADHARGARFAVGHDNLRNGGKS